MRENIGNFLVGLLAIVIVCVVCVRLYIGSKLCGRDLFLELLAAAG